MVPRVDFDPLRHDGMAFFRGARCETPVFFSETLQAYVLTRHADCKAVLDDTGGAISARIALVPNVAPAIETVAVLERFAFLTTPALVDEDGAAHTAHRSATEPPFAAGRVAALDGYVRRLAHARLDAIVEDGEADIVGAMVSDVAARVLLHLVGLADDDMDVVDQLVAPFTELQFGWPSDDRQALAARGLAAMGAWARELSQRRIDVPGDDVVSEAHRNLEATGAMDRDFLDAYTLGVVMAGHNQTTNAMAGGVKALLEHPEQYAALVGDPSLIAGAVEEVLRWSPGVQTWRQLVVRDFALPSGPTLPAGAKVYVALHSANRDEDVFKDGERFDIRRVDAALHLAFGTGPHECLGRHLAVLELRIMLEALSQRLPHATLVPNQEWVTSPNTSQRGPLHVRLRWDVRGNPPAPPTSPTIHEHRSPACPASL